MLTDEQLRLISGFTFKPNEISLLLYAAGSRGCSLLSVDATKITGLSEARLRRTIRRLDELGLMPVPEGDEWQSRLARASEILLTGNTAKKPKATKSEALALCNYFYSQYNAKYPNPYVPSWAADVKLMHEIFRCHGIDKTLRLIDAYFELTDDFTKKRAHSLGWFKKKVNELSANLPIPVELKCYSCGGVIVVNYELALEICDLEEYREAKTGDIFQGDFFYCGTCGERRLFKLIGEKKHEMTERIESNAPTEPVTR